MNFIKFDHAELYREAVTIIELDAAPTYELDPVGLRILSANAYEIGVLLNDNGLFMFELHEDESNDEHDQFRSDAEADADALASAGMGTDEDYGYFGGGDDE